MPNSTHSAPDAKSRAYVLQRIAAEAKKRLHKNHTGLMNETVNPLWNINERQAQLVYDSARTGNYAQIQYLYNEIEERDPTLLVCVTRRTSAVAELDWRVVRSDERLNRKADKNLIQEQIECVETAMAKVDNMPDALEHLALSAFRGFSVVAPIHDASGDLKHLDLIDSWNLCFDRLGQSWYFNPTASSFTMPTSEIGRNAFKGLQYIPREQICAVTRKREIDWPAMQIFLRASIGERDWGRFLETYGLPPVIITMPEFTSKDEQEAYVQAAESVFEGRSGVVPFGSSVSYGSESRGTNPFTEFIEHQQKLVVMMATGGTLASLAESTGLGNGASDVQQDEWLRIIRADKRIISNAINKQICEPILRAHKDFKDKPILAEFQLDDTPKPTPKEMLELASTAASAGFEMDAEELSQACGFTLRKKVEGGGFGDFGGGGGGGEPTQTVTIPDKPSDLNGGDEEHHEDAATVTNVDEGAGLTMDEIESRLETKHGFRGYAQLGTRGSLYRRNGDYEFKDGNEVGKMLAVYEKNGYFDVSVWDLAVGSRKNTKRIRTLQELDSYIGSVYASYKSQVRNAAALPPKTPQDGEDGRGANKDTPSAPKPPTPVSRGADAAGADIVASLQKDFKPVADHLAQILALPKEQRAAEARKMIVELPSLVPNDPTMAEVIAGQMEAAFREQLRKQPDGGAPAANKAVPNAKNSSAGQTGKTRWVTIGHTPVLVDENGNPVDDSKAATEARKAEFPYESDVSKWPAGPTDRDIAEKPYRAFKAITKVRLENAVNKAWCEGVDVPDAATVWYKKKDEKGNVETVKIDIDIGKEDFDGKGGHGLLHVATDHSEKQIKKIPAILAAGKYFKDESEHGAYLVVYGKDVLSLKPKENGKFRIASSYEAKGKAEDYIRRGGQVLNCVIAEGE